MIYKFNDITIDTKNYQLLQNTNALTVEPQVFNLIVYLIEHRDRVILRQELLDALWEGKIVSDATISNHIKSARKVLGDDGRKQAIIKTIHGRGYQFIAKYECKNRIKPNQASHQKNKPKYIKFLLVFGLVVLFTFILSSVLQKQTKQSDNNNPSKVTVDQSIAVLAFKDMSENSDQAYFSEGISEELLNVFTKIPNLRVASRTSSFSFQNKALTIEEIGKELNVDYIMEGSVRKSGGKLRVTAQLIRIADGSHMWSETYNHTMEDIFKIQDEIALEVTKQLKIKLNQDKIKVTPVDSHAYILYLQAIYLLKENTESSIKKAIKLMGESISKDSNYAPAWTAYSRILYTAVIYSYKKDNKGAFILAKQAVTKALELDPYYAQAHAQMTLINLLEWNMPAAQASINRAMELNNKSSSVVGVYAYYMQISGQLAKNVTTLEQAINLDPLNNVHYINLGIAYLMLHRLDEALYMLEKYEYFHPDAVAVHAMKSHVFLVMNKIDEAFNAANKEVNEYWKLSTLGFVTYAQGDFATAEKILNQLIAEYGQSMPGHIASQYAFRQDADNAFKWLEISFNKHSSSLMHVINFQTLRPLWDDPRWDKFINKIGLAKGHWLLEKRLEG
ncbi:MAG: winged helix-turn-helix domain-containing protein [Proteobacteria bacterium]|nr:winged helix-turn-helix domain-containing protein [Pseudomonadota bacterium]